MNSFCDHFINKIYYAPYEKGLRSLPNNYNEHLDALQAMTIFEYQCLLFKSRQSNNDEK